MKKNSLSAVVCLFVLLQTQEAFSQRIKIESANLCASSVASNIPVTTETISNLGALTLFIQFDTLSLKFNGLTNVHANLSGILANQLPGEGKIGIVWSASSTGANIPAGQLFSLSFIPKRTGITNLNFDGSNCELSDFSENILHPIYIGTMIEINELPEVEFDGLADNYCLNANPAPLSLFPSGGVLSGPGIVNTQFIAAIAGAGTHTITYTYTNNKGCSASSSKNVTVLALPQVSLSGLAPEYCPNASPVQMTGTPAGGIFTGDAVSGSIFSPNKTTVGPHAIYYIYTDNNGCKKSASFTTQVLPPPVVNFTGLSSEYCPNAANALLIGTPAGGVFTGDGVVGNTFGASRTTVGPHYIVYTYTNEKGCVGKKAYLTTVVPPPVVSFSGLAAEYCPNSPIAQLTGAPAGGVFSGDAVSGTTFDPSRTTVGDHYILYTYTDTKGCVGKKGQLTKVLPPPVVSFKGLAKDYCLNSAAVTLGGVPSGGVFSGDGISGNTFDPYNAWLGDHFVLYTYFDDKGCRGRKGMLTTVHEVPLVTVSPINIEIASGSSVLLTANGANQYTWSTADMSTIAINSANSILATPYSPLSTYTVTGTNSWNCSSIATATVKLIGAKTTTAKRSAGVVSEQLQLQTAPNPADHYIQLTVPFKLKNNATLQIIDMFGKQVLNKTLLPENSGTVLLNTTDLSSGIYYIQLITEEQSFNHKIEIIH